MTLPTSGLITVNDRGARAATTFGSVAAAGGNMVFIKKLTASSSATLSFVDGTSSVVLDNTYKEYIFTFKNIHAATDEAHLTLNMSVDAGSNYNVTKTTTSFQMYHRENDEANPAVAYSASHDLAQGTGFQNLIMGLGTDNDQNGCGSLHLFNPSSTTFVKHFIAVISNTEANDYATQYDTAGYGNTTSAVDAIQFKMSSGNIDAGDICLYGIL